MSWKKSLLTRTRAIPASALNEPESDDEDDEVVGEMRDDERSGTRYNVCIPLACLKALIN